MEFGKIYISVFFHIIQIGEQSVVCTGTRFQQPTIFCFLFSVLSSKSSKKSRWQFKTLFFRANYVRARKTIFVSVIRHIPWYITVSIGQNQFDVVRANISLVKIPPFIHPWNISVAISDSGNGALLGFIDPSSEWGDKMCLKDMIMFIYGVW